MASQYYKKYYKVGTEQHLQTPCTGFNSFIGFWPRQSMMLAFSPNSVHSFVKKFRLKFFQARKMKSVESQSNFFPAIFRNFLVSIKKCFLSLLKNFLLEFSFASPHCLKRKSDGGVEIWSKFCSIFCSNNLSDLFLNLSRV